jgi:hypothetical protein
MFQYFSTLFYIFLSISFSILFILFILLFLPTNSNRLLKLILIPLTWQTQVHKVTIMEIAEVGEKQHIWQPHQMHEGKREHWMRKNETFVD